MSGPQTVADVLDVAADLLTPEGAWTQGVWLGSNNCMCMEGAIYGAVNANPWMGEPTADAAVDFLVGLLPPTAGNIVAHWNDAPDRTQAEVVAKLREAAQLARAREGTPT